MLTTRNLKIASEYPLITHFFGEDAPYSQLASSFIGQNNPARGWTSYQINSLSPEMLDDQTAQFLSKVWPLQDAKLFPVDRRV
jgi:hypothetical protein